MHEHRPTVAQHLNENVRALESVAERIRSGATRAQLAVEVATNVLARPTTVGAILALAAVWCVYNATALRAGFVQVDPPPFFWLQGVASIYSTVVTTMVLTVQRRQAREAEQRAQLEFQVNLLAEQKATKIISLLEELRRDLPLVQNREDPIADAMQEALDPDAVLRAIETSFETPPSSESDTSEDVSAEGPRKTER